MLNDLDLKEFQELCRNEYWLEIDNQEASDFWNSLINLLIWISSNNFGNGF